ncbi:hypothetical protein [Jiangella mangrovi]|uniref:Glycosyltransferase n=1 Tax=Jiangella mangrovi TaxID=1524084 RepID=A0A7W9GQZ7_9ACTN|nr:hypothetical protein [Jiangella mangrovi]MBB5788402.1 hypothetical protein [Jiangella mangrovi]
MKTVILTTNPRLSPALITETRTKMGAADLPVDVVSWGPASAPLDDVAGTHLVVGPPKPARPTSLPGKVVRKLDRSKPGRALSRIVRGGLSRQFWARIRRSDDARRLLSGADVIVALDVASIRSAWSIARRRPDVVAVYGAAAAAQHVERLTAAG